MELKPLITISGSSGFLGKNLINYLIPNRFNLLKRGETSIYSSHAVINLAGYAHDLKSVADPSFYYQVNTEYSNRLFDAFLASDAEVFITISSVKAIADATDEILTEDSSPNPQTHYGKSKLMAEYYIQSKRIKPGKRVYILRPCMIHGPGNKGNLNLVYQVIKKGFTWPLAAFSNKRSYCSVENICFVIKEIIERNEIASGVYHVSDDFALDTNHVVQLIGKSLKRNVRMLPIPKRLVKFIARLGDFLHLPLNSERLSKLTQNYIVSNKKLKNALGKDLPVNASEGLLATFESFKS